MSKIIMPDDFQDSILRGEERGEVVYKECAKENVCGEKLCDKKWQKYIATGAQGVKQ